MKHKLIQFMSAIIICAFALEGPALSPCGPNYTCEVYDGLPLAVAYLGAESDSHMHLGTSRDKYPDANKGYLRPRAFHKWSSRADGETASGGEGRPLAAGEGRKAAAHDLSGYQFQRVYLKNRGAASDTPALYIKLVFKNQERNRQDVEFVARNMDDLVSIVQTNAIFSRGNTRVMVSGKGDNLILLVERRFPGNTLMESIFSSYSFGFYNKRGHINTRGIRRALNIMLLPDEAALAVRMWRRRSLRRQDSEI